MDKIALKLQERLVQTCIDFINEHKDDEQVKEIQMVEFVADNLQESVRHGIKYWVPTSNEGYFIERFVN
mgnify:CR=1 FL=1